MDDEKLNAANAATREGNHRAYVGKIPDSVDDASLTRILRVVCGDGFVGFKRVSDPRTNAGKSFGFASFASAESAMTCVWVLDGLEIVGGRLTSSANAATRDAHAENGGKRRSESDLETMREMVRGVLTKGGGVGREGEEEGEIADASDVARAGVASGTRETAASENGSGRDGERSCDQVGKNDDEGVRGRASSDGGSSRERREGRTRARSGERDGSRERDARRDGYHGARFGDARAPRGHDYEVTERIERLCREREKVCDEIAATTSRLRSRREKLARERKVDRREAMRRDLEDMEGEDGEIIPLWDRSDKERERRKRFREREMEEDARDRRAEEEERARAQAEAVVAVDRDNDERSGGERRERRYDLPPAPPEPSHTVTRGFTEPAVPPPPTSFGLPRKPVRESALTAGLKHGLDSGANNGGARKYGGVFDPEDGGEDRVRRRKQASSVDVAALVASVPVNRDDVFAASIDWSVYEDASIETAAERWISKKFVDLLGEPEPSIIRFVLDKLSERPKPLSLVSALAPILDQDIADDFVLALWRVLIFEIKHELLERD
ncbi:NADH:ubiquinone oxidoreductase, 51kDa subunit,conserved site [Ostreococcus tauri]|uniref:NADH:ubiquinone oxidoreductase, 51kDa subunit,conserved site n=1 Tax=Ostreococcus tauri TaxID=70448 RepID=Q00VF8_OSTTA|nr:NADH:ubiquinone oxidoreductase, 51kDa subunit,conserved site [Ostreococcus tauri]CAL57469.1 NADH:ubiquinone oxidoreductase, 51kDa subunit,conserved site [Ostreococcus tauri]|eukprot:XP_003083194.1 NADH:ubiquinone oxidoreductase, 51kDa subunit,conserved site [Ostreococcus tauri]